MKSTRDASGVKDRDLLVNFSTIIFFLSSFFFLLLHHLYLYDTWDIRGDRR